MEIKSIDCVNDKKANFCRANRNAIFNCFQIKAICEIQINCIFGRANGEMGDKTRKKAANVCMCVRVSI